MSKTLQVLVFMPMLPGYEIVRKTVADAIAGAHLELVWLEDLLEDWEWLDWLYASVNNCDLVVADPSKHNAFVMYELGIAHPKRQPTLIVLDREDSQLSGSLDGSPFRPYSNDHLEDFANRLRSDLLVITRAIKSEAVPIPNASTYFRHAECLMTRFVDETGQNVDAVDEITFNRRLNHAMSQGTFKPALAGTPLGEAGLLTALIRSSRMVQTMAAMREWIDRHVKT